jgi:hypothetical protein
MRNDPLIDPAAQDPCLSPVFVLSASRSGSTLLRFILDSHPDLACPPETSIASACAGLARSWDVLENAESGNRRPVTEPVSLPPHVRLAVRAAIDEAFGHYLRRRGKRRWCDKSLDTYQFADLITQVYPAAKFICLYRHCMDVIASGVEVCPWGLHRFGFDQFVAQFPGNSVAAIGGYWLSCAQTMLAFEEQHPQSCHRLRYEDLVTAPEETAAAIFSCIGAEPVPGITEACFRTAHEGGGPGDEKIWFTTSVSSGSLGRGVSVPARALPPQLRQSINEMLGKLGYREVNDEWDAAAGPIDPRTDSAAARPASVPAARANGHAMKDHGELRETVRAITTRVESGGAAVWGEISASWPALTGATVRLVVQSADGDHDELPLVLQPADAPDGSSDREPRTVMTASPATWHSLLNGSTNLVTEITAGRLRCVDKTDAHRIRSETIHAVATLLQIAKIPVARTQDDSASIAVPS